MWTEEFKLMWQIYSFDLQWCAAPSLQGEGDGG
jgi:hypothetical protein